MLWYQRREHGGICYSQPINFSDTLIRNATAASNIFLLSIYTRLQYLRLKLTGGIHQKKSVCFSCQTIQYLIYVFKFLMTQTICKLVRLTFISILTKQLQFQKKKKETTRNYIPSLKKKKKKKHKNIPQYKKKKKKKKKKK